MTEYNYTLSFLHVETLDHTIKESAISANFQGISALNLDAKILFAFDLSVTDKAILDGIIADHELNGSTDIFYQLQASQSSQALSVAFGETLLMDWMRYNTLEGMSIEQSLWVFSRFEDYHVEFGNGPKKIDLFKLFTSGALPTAYYCLLGVALDDMTETYHWLNATRMDWVKSRIEARLGAGYVAYVQGLYATYNP